MIFSFKNKCGFVLLNTLILLGLFTSIYLNKLALYSNKRQQEKYIQMVTHNIQDELVLVQKIKMNEITSGSIYLSHRLAHIEIYDNKIICSMNGSFPYIIEIELEVENKRIISYNYRV